MIMRTITRHIPNAITSLNLLSGCVAIILAPISLKWAFVAVVMGAVLDFFDGFAARQLKAYSPIGKDLDSLADVVTFGVAPSVMLFYRLQGLLPDTGWQSFLPYLAFLLAIFSALRLAIFNNDERQTQHFIGLPTPANGFFWGALSAITVIGSFEAAYLWMTIALIPLFSWLLVSNIQMFSLKTTSFGWEGNEIRYLFLISALFLCTLLWLEGVVLTILLYIALSVFTQKRLKRG